MDMRLLATISFCTMIGGCASLPSLPASHQVRISDVIAAMECEISEARNPKDTSQDALALANWLVSREYTSVLKLIVTDNNAFGGDVSLNVPVSVGSTIIGLSGGLALTDRRTVEINLSGDFDKAECRLDTYSHGDWRLGGKIGLKDWLAQMFAETEGISSSVGTVRHNLQFIIKPNHSLKPRFTLVPAGLTGAGINPSWTGSRQDDHSLAIQISKKVPAKVVLGSVPAKPLYVSVVTETPDPATTSKINALSAELRNLGVENSKDTQKLVPPTAFRELTPDEIEAQRKLNSRITSRNSEMQNLNNQIKKLRRSRRAAPAPRITGSDTVRAQQYQEDRLNNSLLRDQLNELGIQ